VIAKEVFANGRLTDANDRPEDAGMVAGLRAAAPGMAADRIAVAFVLAHPFVDVALSGAATAAQLRSHVVGSAASLGADALARLAPFAETPDAYWASRSRLPWS
jgi:aryl-alcohol dehydrogenase-like predicted oxidoreductase